MKIEKHNIIVNYCGGGIAATLDAFFTSLDIKI